MQEVLRLWATWLADGSNGVNAYIAGLAGAGLLSPGHVAPPAIAQIITQDDDVRMAYGDKGETWPALVLLDEDDGDFEGEVATSSRDGIVRVTCLYVPRDREATLSYRISNFTRRAVMRSTEHWLKNASDPQRTENAIYVITAGAGPTNDGIRRRGDQEVIRGIPHAGGLTYTLTVRDRTP